MAGTWQAAGGGAEEDMKRRVQDEPPRRACASWEGTWKTRQKGHGLWNPVY